MQKRCQVLPMVDKRSIPGFEVCRDRGNASLFYDVSVDPLKYRLF
jgi:hypothetical protein